jgi:hypothetical protein
MAWKTGFYTIQNPSKYFGEKKELKYKSGLEERVFYYCDNNLNVIKWGYEVIKIEYLKPIFENWQLHHVEKHNYIPDLYLEIKENSGNIVKYLVEIKSKSDTIPPKQPSRMTQKALLQYQFKAQTYACNSNKWKSAEKWCKNNGIVWKLLTDDKIW